MESIAFHNLDRKIEYLQSFDLTRLSDSAHITRHNLLQYNLSGSC